jgi:hypothetical protein
MENQTHFEVTINTTQSPSEVFAAINNPRKWWQGDINGTTDSLNDEFTYEVPGIHFSRQKIVTLIPDQKIIWLVTESNLAFVKEQDEWTGTTIEFTINRKGQNTEVVFAHKGLVPAFACYPDCANAWEAIIGKSLTSYISTGKGVKVF